MKKYLTVLLFVFIPIMALAEPVKVVSIDDNMRISLSNGDNIRAANIFFKSKLKDESKEFIRQYYLDKPVVYSDKFKNRNGVYLVFGDMPFQLVAHGLAYFYPLENLNADYNEYYKAENQAIEEKTGLWKNEMVINNNEAKVNLNKYLGEFKLIEGQVFEVKTIKDKTYINFGKNWRDDFTVLIRKENLQNFSDAELKVLEGKKIRVRGWVESYNGPLVEIYNKWHLQIL